MTLKQLNNIRTKCSRLAESYRSLIATRNTIIDSFDKEFLRHQKLTAKKENPKEALKESLKKSRNMKKIQKEFLDNKSMIKQNQLESKSMKRNFQEARKTYEQGFVQKQIKRQFA